LQTEIAASVDSVKVAAAPVTTRPMPVADAAAPAVAKASTVALPVAVCVTLTEGPTADKAVFPAVFSLSLPMASASGNPSGKIACHLFLTPMTLVLEITGWNGSKVATAQSIFSGPVLP
jgi:hypothetical protein